MFALATSRFAAVRQIILFPLASICKARLRPSPGCFGRKILDAAIYTHSTPHTVKLNLFTLQSCIALFANSPALVCS
jgi:hypothetical protein